MKPITLKIKKVDDRAVIPQPAHKGDAAMDVTVIDVKYDSKTDRYIYETGLAFETDEVCAIHCFPRSSVYKFDYYLTNGVGIVDSKTYRGTIKAIFAHRDSIKERITRVALNRWDSLPWYKKIKRHSLIMLKLDVYHEFMADPLAWAPYKPGDRAFQIEVTRIEPLKIIETTELSDTERGENGHGSSGGYSPI